MAVDAYVCSIHTGKVCVYIRRLANVDLKVLETLVARSVAETKRRYPQAAKEDDA